MFENLTGHLLKISETRVWRTYTGGTRIDEWHGKSGTQNGHFPEDWIASTVIANNPGREHLKEGLSRVLSVEGEPALADVVASNPTAWLGEAHVKRFGVETGVLVKLLDAAERLCIQVHPDLDYAQKIFNSAHGKTESWYVLDDSPCNGNAPCIYFGFKPHVTRALWKEVFEKQDILRMLDCLHKIPVKKGDVFFIAGGVPHAIGEGCFVIETQEPTDYTMRTELVTPGGLKVHENQCHQGAGFEKMLDCFHYDSHTLEQTLALWKVKPLVTEKTEGYLVISLIDSRQTNLFSMRKIHVSVFYEQKRQKRLSVLLVVSGQGKLETASESHRVVSGDYWIVPATVGELKIIAENGDLQLVECLPPEV